MITARDLDRMAALDKVEVTGIEVWAHHGVFDHERRDGQPFLIDVEWWCDTTRAAQTDTLSSTIDYGEVSALVVSLVQSSPVDLIETLATRLRQSLLARFPMDYVRITIHKPQAPLGITFTDVSVTTLSGRHNPLRTVVFSLGSNIEPRLDLLQFAVSGLVSTPGICDVRVSPVYETEAQGDLAQADFLNAVLVAQSALSAHELLRRGLELESMAHRTRLIEHGPRTLDIDLIAVGDEQWADPELVLPHPRAAVRAFVLVPWSDLDPDALLGTSLVSDLVKQVSDQAVLPCQGRLFLP